MSECKSSRLPQKRLNSLQYLRSACALSVVGFHTEIGIHAYWPETIAWSLFSWGHYGVPAFFCLSGFVISYSAFARPRRPLDFIWSRAIRIYPAYLAIGLLYIALLYTLPQGELGNSFRISIDSIIRFLLFNLGQPGGLVYVGWTLFYEMCFYIAFCALIKNFRNASQSPLYSAILSILIIATSISRLNRVNYFLGGMATFSYLRFPNGRTKLILCIAALGCYALNPETTIICTIILLLIGVEKTFSDIFTSKEILATGDSSFSIYLAQVLTIGACLRASSAAATKFPYLFESQLLLYTLTMLTAFASTIAVGVTARRFIEKPAYQLLSPNPFDKAERSQKSSRSRKY